MNIKQGKARNAPCILPGGRKYSVTQPLVRNVARGDDSMDSGVRETWLQILTSPIAHLLRSVQLNSPLQMSVSSTGA